MSSIRTLSSLYLFLFALTFSQSLFAEEQVKESSKEFDPSWSLDFVVEPSATHLLGTDINDFGENFQYIEQVSCEHQSLNVEQCQQVADSGGQFEMLIDGNNDGHFERWQIAVAKLHGGQYAKVILVQDDESNKLLQVLLVESVAPGFSALYLHQGQIMWGMCLSCDVLADVVWEDGSYRVKWQPNLSAEWPLESLANNN